MAKAANNTTIKNQHNSCQTVLILTESPNFLNVNVTLISILTTVVTSINI